MRVGYAKTPNSNSSSSFLDTRISQSRKPCIVSKVGERCHRQLSFLFPISHFSLPYFRPPCFFLCNPNPIGHLRPHLSSPTPPSALNSCHPVTIGRNTRGCCDCDLGLCCRRDDAFPLSREGFNGELTPVTDPRPRGEGVTTHRARWAGADLLPLRPRIFQ
jgi:hypothetical protein